MLKKRLAACLTVRDGIVVQSYGFQRWLPVGSLAVAVEFLNRWGVDEIIIADIGAAHSRTPLSPDLLRSACAHCFVPVTVGGGIASLDHMQALMHAGADKVALNTAALDDPALIGAGASLFGSQCMVVSMDVRQTGPNAWQVFSRGGRVATNLSPVEWAQEAERRGAGELMINSIDRDGSYTGYDLDLVRCVADAVRIPVIACGGAGCPEDFQMVLAAGADAAAAGNYFHHMEHSVIATKEMMARGGVDVRRATRAHYTDAVAGERGRLSGQEHPLLPACNYRPE